MPAAVPACPAAGSGGDAQGGGGSSKPEYPPSLCTGETSRGREARRGPRRAIPTAPRVPASGLAPTSLPDAGADFENYLRFPVGLV